MLLVAKLLDWHCFLLRLITSETYRSLGHSVLQKALQGWRFCDVSRSSTARQDVCASMLVGVWERKRHGKANWTMMPAGDATSGDAPALCLSILFLSTLVVGCDRRSRTQGLAIHTSAGIWVRVQVSQACKVDKKLFSYSVAMRGRWVSVILRKSGELRDSWVRLCLLRFRHFNLIQYLSTSHLEAALDKTPPQFSWSLLWNDNVLSQILHHSEQEWLTTLDQFGQCHLLGLGKMTQTFQRLIGERPSIAQSLKWTCLLCVHSYQETMYHSYIINYIILYYDLLREVRKEFQTACLLCMFEGEAFRTESSQILAVSTLTIPGSLRLAGKISSVLSSSTLGKRCTSRHETQLEWCCPCLASTWAEGNKRFRSQSPETNHNRNAAQSIPKPSLPSLPRSITIRLSNSPGPLVEPCTLLEVLRLDGCKALQGFARLNEMRCFLNVFYMWWRSADE